VDNLQSGLVISFGLALALFANGCSDRSPSLSAPALRTFDHSANLCVVAEPRRTVACLGSNIHGDLGQGTFGGGSYKTLTAVKGVENVLAVTTGAFGACALRTDHVVVCWGCVGRPAADDGAETCVAQPQGRARGADEITMGTAHLCIRQGSHV